MVLEWENTTIGAMLARDGGSIKTGPFGTALKAAEYTPDGVPLISVGEIGYGSISVHKSTPKVSSAVLARLPIYILRAGDIVFARKGAVDRSAIVRKDQDGWFLGSDGIRLRLSASSDPRFIGYHLRSLGARSWLFQHATGSTMPSLNQDVIERIPIRLPRLEEQLAISSVLSAFDDKIELNRRMNETLEAVARAIFQDWFVTFGPTRAKMEGRPPYLAPDLWSLFPDRLDAEGKPEGWALCPLSVVARLERQTVSPASSPDKLFDHYSIPAFDAGRTPVREIGVGILSNKMLVSPGTILLSKLNPEIPRVWLIDADPTVRSICSTEFLILSPTVAGSRAFLYCVLTDPGFTQRLQAQVTGTSKSHQRVKPQSVMDAHVIAPQPDVLKAFQHQVMPLLDRLLANQRESRTLAATRDLLLPRLMSGELRVKDAERAIETAA